MVQLPAMLTFLRRRLPTRAASWPVLSVFLFLVNSWALYRLFWYLPSWLEYLSLPRVLVIGAYALAWGLLESLALWILTLIISAMLPARWFREQFAPQGALIGLAAGLGAFLVQRQVSMIYKWEIWQVWAYTGLALAALFGGILLVGYLLRRYPRLLALATALAERMTVFGYIYLPLGILGLGWVLVRNLFLGGGQP